MKASATVMGVIFGATMILLSLAVTVETLLRKFFAHSMAGIDELGGYAIAICAPLCFAVALIERSHIRINLLHMRLSRPVQAVLNALAALSMGVLGAYLLYFTVKTVIDTQTYRSIAQTPWATPLIYPQAVWLVAMAVFAGVALLLAGRAVILLAGGNWLALNRQFGPSSAQEELEAELEDLKKREGAAQ
ncbi:MAG: TRAP transporter small permease [Bauldia sp.]|nr:MAG: TRAP transporter small permease [Bauldia sp.]MBE0692140.1 TRAP transporter small permease [Aquamicrobium sp.]